MKAARKLRQAQQPRSLLDYVRQLLTPEVCKQARQAVPRRGPVPRWDLQPLLLIALAMTWASGRVAGVVSTPAVTINRAPQPQTIREGAGREPGTSTSRLQTNRHLTSASPPDEPPGRVG